MGNSTIRLIDQLADPQAEYQFSRTRDPPFRTICKCLLSTTMLVLLAPAVKAGDAAPPNNETSTAELRGATQALLDAIAPGDVAVWDRLLDSNAIQVDENDVVRSKAEILADLKPLGPGLEGRLTIDAFQVVRHENTAVVTHEDNEFLNYHGQIILSRFRNTDTWVWTSDGWKQIASQVLAVQKDPPSHALDRKVLCSYAGTYELTTEIRGALRCVSGALVFEREGRPDRQLQPELLDVFFEAGAPRTRHIFQRDEKGHIKGFIDRREGRDIIWRRMGALPR